MGVTHLALTDHDTVAGLTEAATEASLQGIALIPGVEFSSQWQGLGVHIVGLQFDIAHPALQQALAQQSTARQARAIEIDRRLAKVGIRGALAGAERIASGALVGRPHFAQYLVEHGAVPSVAAAFKRYLGAGKIGDVKQGWLDVSAVVSAIVVSGGTAVLAHPLKYKITLTRLRRLLAEFCAAGGQAIEVSSGPQTPSETKSLAELAKSLGLSASCGSDFHTPTNAWQELGAYAAMPVGLTPVWQSW